MIKCDYEEVSIYGPDSLIKDELVRVMIGFIVLLTKQGKTTEEIEKFFMKCVVAAFWNLDRIKEKNEEYET